MKFKFFLYNFFLTNIYAGYLEKILELTDKDKKDFVDSHNEWRNRAAKGLLFGNHKAANLPEIRWAEDLAKNSERY